MPGAREDYVIRMIREAVQVLARLAGLRREGQFATEREELLRAKRLIAADTGPVLDRLDAETAVHLLGDPRRALTYAELLEEEALLERLAGNAERSVWAARRSAAVARLVAARPDAPDEAHEVVARLTETLE